MTDDEVQAIAIMRDPRDREEWAMMYVDLFGHPQSYEREPVQGEAYFLFLAMPFFEDGSQLGMLVCYVVGERYITSYFNRKRALHKI